VVILVELVLAADSVLALQWSTASEWVLISGGADGAIRFWDIRRTGCFQVLDQHHSQLGRRPPVLNNAAQRNITTVMPKRVLLIVICT
jgi:DNA excision repair protein ERCC-8